MDLFLYQLERESLVEDKVLLKGYFVDENSKKHQKTFEMPYIVNIEKEGFESLGIKESEVFKKRVGIIGPNLEEVIEIETFNKDFFEYLTNLAKENQIKVFESDLNPVYRLLIEEKVKIYQSLEKDTQKISERFKLLSLDIETLGVGKEIIIGMVAISTKIGSCVFVNNSKTNIEKLKGVFFENCEVVLCENEEELLKNLINKVSEIDPHIIIGWNVINFDFEIIKKKCESFGIEFNFSNKNGNFKMRTSKNFFSKSNLSFPGIVVFDGIQTLRTNFIEFEEYNLNYVASCVLKEEKISLDDENETQNKVELIERCFSEDPKKLVKYNIQDSVLVLKIFEKLSLIELIVSRSLITSTPIEKIQSPIASLDIMYLKKLHKENKLASSNANYNSQNQILGAFVISPKPGIYKNIFVLDFKSLYPSIIVTFNIDPFKVVKDIFGKLKSDYIESPNLCFLSKNFGILPEIILQLNSEREKAKKEKSSVKSYAIKITMNSFYGAIASPRCRFYNRELAEAITSFGRLILQKSKQYLEEEKNMKVIYGDTDSVFVEVLNEFENFSEKKKFGKKLEKELNIYFENFVLKNYGIKSKLKIEFEKIYSKFFIASKKRYAGFNEVIGKNEYVGLELVRRDWTKLARDFQTKILENVFLEKGKEEIEILIKKTIENLENGKLDDYLLYKKSITKPLKEYTKTTPPHVKAARELKVQNLKLIKYVMTKNGPKHISLFNREKEEYDYNHYIEKQLKGVSSDILKCLGIDFDEVSDFKKQKSLKGFF